MTIVRRSFEALLIIIAPATTILSCGSDIFVKLAFGEKFLPAATGAVDSVAGLRDVLSEHHAGQRAHHLGQGVVEHHHLGLCPSSPSPCSCSFASRLAGGSSERGAQCAGAATAIIFNEIGVVIAMLTRFDTPALDRRNVVVIVKSIAIAACVITTDCFIRGLGPARLVADSALYAALAVALRVVHFDDVRAMI